MLLERCSDQEIKPSNRELNDALSAETTAKRKKRNAVRSSPLSRPPPADVLLRHFGFVFPLLLPFSQLLPSFCSHTANNAIGGVRHLVPVLLLWNVPAKATVNDALV
jgi:hypothetical protein